MTERSSAGTEELRHTVALEIWHRFADSNVQEWDDETHKAEYLLCADDIIALCQSDAPAQRTADCGAQWTPDQFWQYVEGLTDQIIRDQMRDMLASKGLSFAPAQPDPIQDTYLVGGPDLKAMSGSVESDRVIQLHFRRQTTDADRKWLLDAINEKIAADGQAFPSPYSATLPEKNHG